MKNHLVYDSMLVFLAAIREVGVTRFVDDSRAFARAVRSVCWMNAFADQFPTYLTVMGRDCTDYRQGLSLAMSGGVCFWEMPEFKYVRLEIGSRFVAKIQRETTEVRFEEAKQLAKAFLEETKRYEGS